MKKLKRITKNNGITLISLVITVVVLLILAGVAISIVVSPDGLFSQAENATEKWNNKVVQENIVMQNVLAQLDKIPSGTTPPETPPVEGSITLNTVNGEVNSGLELEVDATLVLTASLNVTATQDIVWSSSDDTIATVAGSGTNNSTGTITGVNAGGPVTITATYGDKTATCSVTVTEKEVALISFTIDVSLTGETFYAIEGWDWATWIEDTNYNTVGIHLDDDGKVCYGGAPLGYEGSPDVYGDTLIVSGGEYTLERTTYFVNKLFRDGLKNVEENIIQAGCVIKNTSCFLLGQFL